MAIVKLPSRVPLPPSSSSSSSDEESSSGSASDSGMDSDELDLPSMGDAGAELIQVGNQSCTIPLDLYDLPDLTAILSLEAWNDILSESDRFALAEHLPDMDHLTFSRTLSDLLSGANFHFGSPLTSFFARLKGGGCDPRVALYRKGVGLFQRREHYHRLWEYQDCMVGRLVRIREVWQDCEGYGVEEKLRLLKLRGNRRDVVEVETDSESDSMTAEQVGTKVVGSTTAYGKKGYSSGAAPIPVSVEHGQCRRQDPITGFDDEDNGYGDEVYEVTNQGELRGSRRSAAAWDVLLKQGKKHKMLRELPIEYGEEDYEGYARPSYYNVRDWNVASYDHNSVDPRKKNKYSYKDWILDRMQHRVPKGVQVDSLAGGHPLEREEFITNKGKFSPDSKALFYNNFPAQMGDSYIRSDHRGNEKIRSISVQNKGIAVEHARHAPMFAESDDTESSSDQVESDGDANPLARKMTHPGGSVEGHQPVFVKVANGSKKANKLKQKGKINKPVYFRGIESIKKTQVPHSSDKLQSSPLKISATERKRKGMTDLDNSLQQSNYMHDYESGVLDVDEEDLDWSSKLGDVRLQSKRSGNQSQPSYSHGTVAVPQEMPNQLVRCTTVTTKRKDKSVGTYPDEQDESFHRHSSPAKQSDDPNLLKKKGKRKADALTGSAALATPEPVEPEKGARDIELEMKEHKKPFTLITPSIHTGFSFSIIHFLSAVRKAMVTTNMEDTMGKMLQAGSGTNPSHLENIDINPLGNAEQCNLPSLTLQEIVNRVRSNPGDPCILEIQEPLQDLVRGLLKIFVSKTAPLGAKGWKALVFYERSNRSWTWAGPVSPSSSDNDTTEEETSSEAWGIPYKMLVKLVDTFANWLKSTQDTLQQIGSLPAPPIMMSSNLDEKERFKDLRAQKSLNTISPTTDEMRAYFRTEEHLRYSVPDRAFSYTGYDGKKSIVAPLRRGGGKPTSKAREHFMLKPDRPPHVTILCLVRDAAARLPGSIGTRADVCTLIRDSQFIVEDITDTQINQAVSGALDRLHYERDPCVMFDGERKLWVYLHRDRVEEDFEDDGTSSTKKWKRQKKDVTNNSDTGAVNDVINHATGVPVADGSSAGFDLNPDLNVDSSSIHAGEQTELIYNELRSNMENIQSYIDSTQGDRSHDNQMSWEALGLNALRENKMMCPENSRNEDFDDEAFNRGRPVGLLSSSML